MQLRRFRGHDLNRVMGQVTASLGGDAMILRTNETEPFAGYGSQVEVVAASAPDVERLRRTLFVDARPPARQKGDRPRVMAFVGPPGSGKTTATLKLLADAANHGDVKLGVLTLDTYRAGALDELMAHARIHGVRVEVAYGLKEVTAALKRLRGMDAVLVDTPGHGGDRFDDAEWLPLLEGTRPDETHLVLPATVRMDVAGRLLERLRSVAPTHLLLTRLDELGGDVGLADLMLALGLPSRWVGAGAALDRGLIPAEHRAFGALGLTPPPPTRFLEVV